MGCPAAVVNRHSRPPVSAFSRPPAWLPVHLIDFQDRPGRPQQVTCGIFEVTIRDMTLPCPTLGRGRCQTPIARSPAERRASNLGAF